MNRYHTVRFNRPLQKLKQLSALRFKVYPRKTHIYYYHEKSWFDSFSVNKSLPLHGVD